MRAPELLLLLVIVAYALVPIVWLGILLYRRFRSKQPAPFLPWVIVTVLWSIPVALAAPNVLRAIQTRNEVRTMYGMDTIRKTLSFYARRHDGAYPEAESIDDLARILGPIPLDDGWGRRYRFVSRRDAYILISLGRDGKAEVYDPWTCPPTDNTNFDSDILLRSGEFVRAANVGADQ